MWKWGDDLGLDVDEDRDGEPCLMESFPSYVSLSPHRVTRGALWSAGASCKALCPGVTSPVTQPPSQGFTPKSTTT